MTPNRESEVEKQKMASRLLVGTVHMIVESKFGTQQISYMARISMQKL